MSQKGLVDPNLESVLRHFAKEKAKSSTLRETNGVVPWFRPPLDNWNGGLRTEAGMVDMHRAFNTDEAETALIAAYEPGDPGNSADAIVLSVQIDYAAQAERAYRARTGQSFPRMLAHLTAREYGHGGTSGAFLGQALDYFINLLTQGAQAEGGKV